MTSQSEINQRNLVLLEGERILWAGKSVRMSRAALIFGAFALILISILAVPLVYSLLTDDRSILARMNFTINGELLTEETPASTLWEGVLIIGILAGVFLVAAVLFCIASLKSNYTLTTRRAVFHSCFIFKRTSSLDLRCVSQIERSGGDRVGSLDFFTAQPSLFERILRLYRVPNQIFANIQSPKEVEALALNAMLAARKEQSS
ncbi:MAG: hypothetical protein AAFR11_15685 [Pseudomonadota bacterium]